MLLASKKMTFCLSTYYAMRNMRVASWAQRIALLPLLAVASLCVCAAEVDSLRPVVGITAGVNGAYVLPHNRVVANLLSAGRYATISHVAASWQARVGHAAEDDEMYGLPRFEGGLLVSDFTHAPLHRAEGAPLIPTASPRFPEPSTMGYLITPYGSIERALARGRRLEFGYRMEQGIGITTARYDKQKNPENELIGGPVSIMVGLGFYADLRVSPHWTIGLEGNFHHYSNGRTFEPNIGVNPLDAGLRAVYTFQPDSAWQRPYEWLKKRRTGGVKYHKHFYGDFSASWLPRALLCEWNYCWYKLDPSDPRYRTGSFKHYHSAAFSGALMYSYSPKYASGIGLEYMYAPIGEQIYHWETLQGRPDLHLQSDHGLSAVLHHEARYKNLAAHLSFGVYLKREPQYTGDVSLPFFETAGVRYYLPVADRRLYVGYNIRAHAITADAFQFSLGYAVGR